MPSNSMSSELNCYFKLRSSISTFTSFILMRLPYPTLLGFKLAFGQLKLHRIRFLFLKPASELISALLMLQRSLDSYFSVVLPRRPRTLNYRSSAVESPRTLMEDKLTTMIVNETGRDLIMKVENRNCFVPLADVNKSSQHALKLCMNWTYQEFLLEEKCMSDTVGKKLFVSSDECCDYERITVKESGGRFVVDRVPRKQINAEEQSVARQGTLSWLRSWLWF